MYKADILEGIRKGRDSIAYAGKGPRLDIGGAGLGDGAAFRPDLKGTVTMTEARRGIA